MAVYCSVCCREISKEVDNCGSYDISENFIDANGEIQDQIKDTCQSCGEVFFKITIETEQKIAQAANKIVADLKEKAEQRKIAEKKQADYEKARAEFDAEYWATHGI